MNPDPTLPVLVLERTFRAPRELVFRAWLTPEYLARWWGPRGFTNPVCEVDARPGGHIRIHMRAPDGTLIPSEGVFEEILEPRRIVFTNSAFRDERGEPQLETRYTVTLAEEDGGTRLTLRAVVTRAGPGMGASLATMREGWNESLDRLAEALSASARKEP